jgi:hypothetical protein
MADGFRTLYYFSKADFLEDALSRRRIKVSRVKALNDPYEVLGIYRRSVDVREQLARWRDNFDATYGFICLCEHDWSPVMWAHYADRHRGVCYRFDVSTELLWKVHYFKKPRSFGDVRRFSPLRRLKSLISTKSLEWRYEREHRYVVSLRDEMRVGDLYFESFSDRLRPREIRLGIDCQLSVEDVRAAARKVGLQIAVSKAKISTCSFRVIEDRDFRD